MDQNAKRSWPKVAMYLLILVSLVLIGMIGYITTFQFVTNLAISNITAVLITVTGILLGLSGLIPASRSLERMKLQITFTIVTILWLALVIVIAQTEFVPFSLAPDILRYSFLAGIGLFTVLVVVYSTATIEATRQRLVAEQAARESQKGRIS
jgi:amino acid transporter